jgi:hypothetical protein
MVGGLNYFALEHGHASLVMPAYYFIQVPPAIDGIIWTLFGNRILLIP